MGLPSGGDLVLGQSATAAGGRGEDCRRGTREKWGRINGKSQPTGGREGEMEGRKWGPINSKKKGNGGEAKGERKVWKSSEQGTA